MLDTESVLSLDIPYQNIPENVKLGPRIKEIYFLNKLNELSYVRTRESLSREPIHLVHGVPQLLLRAAKGSFWHWAFAWQLNCKTLI